MSTVAADVDMVLGFTLPGRSARGRLVRAGPVLDAILAAHDYPEPLARLLADALVLTALIGATLRGDEGQTTVQAQGSGGFVDMLVCDYLDGRVRGYLRLADGASADAMRPGMNLSQLFGEGYLAVTLDQSAVEERYQGIVPLVGANLAAAIESYFAVSEQIPTLVRVAADRGTDGWVAGGLLLQHLPRGEEGQARLHVDDEDEMIRHPDWVHVEALAATISPAELTDPRLPLTTLLWQLFNDDTVNVVPATELGGGCRCSAQRFTEVLRRFPPEELAEMRGDDGFITVDCEFCSSEYKVAL